MQLYKKQTSESGFTLIELMITIAILGIIASIALPSYSSYVKRGNRSEGRAYLVNAAALMERYYSDNNVYATAANSMPTAVGASATSETGLYNGTIVTATPFQAYTLVATATFADSECLTLTLDQAGVKRATGTLGSATEPGECWTK